MKYGQAVRWGMATALLAMSAGAAASGFALVEHGSGLGNAFAGGAASAEDASTVYFNPAGMAQLSGKQIVVAAHAIRPSMKFGNTVSVPASLQPAGGNGGDAGSWVLLPNAYFVTEIAPEWRFGIGIDAPFGLQTEYDANWIGRFQAIKSRIQTINLNPSVSYQVSDSLSIGAGVSYQHIRGDLTSAVNFGPFGAALTEVSGSDSAWGGNVGVLYKVTPETRVGAAYRSRIKYNLNGTVVFSGVPTLLAGLAPNGPVTLPLTMPDSFSVSVFHQASDKCDLMADLTWTGWSVLKQLNIMRPDGTTLGGAPTQENWRDTWRVAIGSNYRYSDQWMARVGAAYDQTPVSDAFRTARVPDANRFQLAVGGQYKPGKNSALDFGYSHLFVSNASIADMQAAAGKGNLIGNYRNSVDIVSVAYAYKF